MKTRHILLWIVLLFCSANICFSTTIPISSRENYIGTWIGTTELGNDLYRITFTEKGGTIGYSFVGSEPVLHRIESWDLQEGKLKIKTNPIAKKTAAIVIEDIGFRRLKIRAKSNKWGWSHEINLLRESDIEGRLQQLKTVMNPSQQDNAPATEK